MPNPPSTFALAAGGIYTYYIFGSPGISTGFNGLNLFFNGNNSTPGISAFGPTNGKSFRPDGQSTLTLAVSPVPGSGTTFYASGDVIVVLTGYDWDTPATPPGDVCQPYLFAPGGGVSFFGSFALQVFPAATLSLSQPAATPGTRLAMSGNGFQPNETVTINFGLGSPPLVATANAGGAFNLAAKVPPLPFGPDGIYAAGESSGKLGAASLFITPGLRISPRTAPAGAEAAAQGFGFGIAEPVQVYWGNPRQLLGTATTTSTGTFAGSSALKFTIPTNAPPGRNAVVGVGQQTGAIGLGQVIVA